MPLERFLQGLGPVPPVLGLAVSGGGDSVALLALAVRAGLRCHAVTVDHGLRAESAAEAEGVARFCAAMGVPHDTLRWHWDGAGNLQDAARRARRSLIAEWAAGRGISAVALGHTRDDVAETFLMRLARGAGLDGLSAMQAAWGEGGTRYLRPLLDVGREELRDWLTAQRMAWVDDPSNEDPRFERVRARRALRDLPLGLTAERLAEVARNLADARAALEAVTAEAARSHAQVQGGDIVIRDGVQPEILRRLILRALDWVGGAEYAPRGAALSRAMVALAEGGKTALQGCGMVAQSGSIRIHREARAVRDLRTPTDRVWDRWRLSGPHDPVLHVAMLGPQGLLSCKDWRDAGLPRASLIASPAVWQGDVLVAAPLAGHAEGWTATHDPDAQAFLSAPISH